MGRILYFMYSGHIRVTELTVCTLLPAATMFQVSNVIDACCAFLERQLDPTNAIGISNFAEQHGCTTLKQRANQFIERHFTQVNRNSEDFDKYIDCSAIFALYNVQFAILILLFSSIDFTRRRIPAIVSHTTNSIDPEG